MVQKAFFTTQCARLVCQISGQLELWSTRGDYFKTYPTLLALQGVI